ncbi:hypothetical protein AB0F88_39570 [Streptosporangium sp. NPDC023963]
MTGRSRSVRPGDGAAIRHDDRAGAPTTRSPIVNDHRPASEPLD